MHASVHSHPSCSFYKAYSHLEQDKSFLWARTYTQILSLQGRSIITL